MQQHALPMSPGVSPSKKKRDKWDFEGNITPSVEDPVFAAQRESLSPKKIVLQSPEEVASLTDGVARIELSREAIGDHLDERISSFFMQLIDCYDTDLYFTVGTTEDQTVSTPTISLTGGGGIHIPHKADKKIDFASAHHGTLPCVYAYPKTAWDIWKLKGNPLAAGKPEPVVYMKNTDSYFLNNACSGLEKAINEADIAIDGNSTEKLIEFKKTIKKPEDEKLREFSIKLLNRVARKNVSPVRALGLFISKLQARIECCANAPRTETERKIFEIWLSDIEEISATVEEDLNTFAAQLVGVQIPYDRTKRVDVQSLVLPSYCKLLKQKNTYQTQLNVLISQLRSDILQSVQKTPKSFDKALKIEIISVASQANERVSRIVQRYFCCSAENAKKLECTKPALQLVRKSRQMIKNMISKVSDYLHNFSVEEASIQGGLVKTVRKAKKISLREFAEIHNLKYPNAHKLNYEQLRRYEMGCVKMDHSEAARFAQVLKLPPRILIPSFCD